MNSKNIDKYPKSRKRIICVCDKCGRKRNLSCAKYKPVCRSCIGREVMIKRYDDPEELELQSGRMKKRYSDPEECKRQSEIAKKSHEDDPTLVKRQSDAQKKSYQDDPDRSKRHSESMKNSDAVKIEAERQRGGYDIVNHHYIYDDSDKSKYTVKMTRSDHSKLHRLLKKLAYIVPHINN